MFNSPDIYLGSFLIFCGFSLSLLNLRRVVKRNKFSSVLLSENVLLMCIGIAFCARGVYNFKLVNMQMSDMEGRMSSVYSENTENTQCTIWSVYFSYGPLILSFVNSFLSLVIDNYLHYEMIKDTKEKDEENMVQDVRERYLRENSTQVSKAFMFWKKYLSYIIIALQWIIPILLSFLMYPMNVNERSLKINTVSSDKCMAMLNMGNDTCNSLKNNFTEEIISLRQYYQPQINYLEAYESDSNRNKSTEINAVVQNLYKIISQYQNSTFEDLNNVMIFRQPKSSDMCIRVCYVDNKNLLLYMFILAIITYFVPITIATLILTKIHMMSTTMSNVKTYVTRELLYNILFWTPVMFDTIISLILCSYSMNGMRTSLLNTVANIYQAVKNFMNTKYFKDNSIVPI